MKYSRAVLIACVSGAMLVSAVPLGQSTSVEPRGFELKPAKKTPSLTPNTLQVPEKPVELRASVHRPRDTTGSLGFDDQLSRRAFDDELFVRAFNEELVERGVMSGHLIEERGFKEESVVARGFFEDTWNRLWGDGKTKKSKPAGEGSKAATPPQAPADAGAAGESETRDIVEERDFDEELVARGGNDNTSGGEERPFGGIRRAKPLPKDFDPSKPSRPRLSRQNAFYIKDYEPASGGRSGTKISGLKRDLDTRDFDLNQLD